MQKRFEKSWIPTRKWFAAQAAAVVMLGSEWFINGSWNKPLTMAAVGFLTQATTSYLIPNAGTPGGVPAKRRDQAFRGQEAPADRNQQRHTERDCRKSGGSGSGLTERNGL
jgi:hypothetical protein